jgi:soluble lytic murein transglycosylase-like protein
MRSNLNIRKTLLRFLLGKSVVFFILLSFIMTLNGWKPDELAKEREKMFFDTETSVSLLSDREIQTEIPSNDIELTPWQKNAQNRYQHLVLEAEMRYQVEPEIIKAIIMAESGFNPKAVSKVGARGLMQLMPRTANFLGVKDSFKPDHNIDAGVRYFKQLLDQFNGEIKLALAAYNAGSYNVRKYKGVPPFKATRIYIDKVLKYYQAYQMTWFESVKLQVDITRTRRYMTLIYKYSV